MMVGELRWNRCFLLFWLKDLIEKEADCFSPLPMRQSSLAYTIGSEIQGFICKKKIYFLSTQHAKNSEVVNFEFSSPQLLLNNAKIDGHDLCEIWDDISID